MTTIAWDGKTLAADRKGEYGNLKLEVTKIFRLEGTKRPDFMNGAVLFAWAGTYQAGLAVKSWLEMKTEKPTLVGEDGNGFFVEGEGDVWRLENRLVRIPVNEKFYAAGSGRDFAMAAMALNQTAVQAVNLASKFDAYTGPTVEFLRLKEGA